MPSSLLLLALWLAQALLVFAFSQRLRGLRRSSDPASLPEGAWPPLEVVLCLRGADACLPRLLEALAAQTYPAPWRLQVVVDSDQDPAWAMISPWRAHEDAAWAELRCCTLLQRPGQGSLKCAALSQAFSQIHPSSALVVLLDADIRFPANGLERCALSCLQPGVGAISGNRWFSPPAPSLGALHWSSWTRAVWNAGAVVLMTLLQIPWGGTLCVRRELVEAGDWSELLKRGLCEDTGLLGPLRQLGLGYRFEPSLLMLDPDPAQPMLPLGRWITRQLLTARLHHPAWPLVAFHGLSSVLLLAFALFQGAWLAVLIYELGCVCLLCWIQVLLRPQDPVRIWGWIVGLLSGQLVDGLATLAAVFTRHVSWRGVDYALHLRPSRVVLRRDRGVEV
ncbi:glycosyltransferase family 2 protein [Synechococcus sp. BIOS-E4-1]|uniref:glycosyltransferase n=1 Tax=Synechococcus sp. BIOS-E4-1 TaxID=1400864 RepID=UPI0016443107|nr:glycosyltransferase [Synechococcus sp. BIOS-E4-1]